MFALTMLMDSCSNALLQAKAGDEQSLMVYAGGLTFDSEHPRKFLKIPNDITAHRFRKALLGRLGMHPVGGGTRT